jgi:hypothetical protein
MRQWLILVGICLLTSSARAGETEAAGAAGYVLSIQQCQMGCVRVHDGHSVTLSRYDEVFAGDTVLVSNLSGRVTLIYYNEAGRTAVMRENSPYVVRAARPGWAAAAANFLDTIRSGLMRSKTNYAVLVTRGNEPNGQPPSGFKPRCLEMGRARIGNGTRILGFAWYASAPPYDVTVYDPAGAVLLRETGLKRSEFAKISAPVTLGLGMHRVVLSDGAGRQIERKFEVIDARAVPVAPAGLLNSTISPGTQTLLRADWLAWSGAGGFCYEAYLSLIPLTYGEAADPDARTIQSEIRDVAN